MCLMTKLDHFIFQWQNKSAAEYIEGSKERIVQYEQQVKQAFVFFYNAGWNYVRNMRL